MRKGHFLLRHRMQHRGFLPRFEAPDLVARCPHYISQHAFGEFNGLVSRLLRGGQVLVRGRLPAEEFCLMSQQGIHHLLPEFLYLRTVVGVCRPGELDSFGVFA